MHVGRQSLAFDHPFQKLQSVYRKCLRVSSFGSALFRFAVRDRFGASMNLIFFGFVHLMSPTNLQYYYGFTNDFIRRLAT